MLSLRDIVFALNAGVFVYADAESGAKANKVDEAGEVAPAFIIAN